MDPYEQAVQTELIRWQQAMQKPPSTFGKLSTSVQKRINRIIPDRIHAIITATIKQVTGQFVRGRFPESCACIRSDIDPAGCGRGSAYRILQEN